MHEESDIDDDDAWLIDWVKGVCDKKFWIGVHEQWTLNEKEGILEA